MTNQRYAGPIKHGTNLTPYESAELDRHIAAAGCKSCPWVVGDIYQRDCCYPECGSSAEQESRVANRCALLASAVLVCFLALFTGLAQAQSVARNAVVSWSAPSTCAGGAAISNCAITGYIVQKLNGTAWSEVGTTAANVTTFTHTNLPLGTHTYRVLANSAAGPSDPSPQGSKILDVPGAPGSIVITVTVTVTS